VGGGGGCGGGGLKWGWGGWGVICCGGGRWGGGVGGGVGGCVGGDWGGDRGGVLLPKNVVWLREVEKTRRQTRTEEKSLD